MWCIIWSTVYSLLSVLVFPSFYSIFYILTLTVLTLLRWRTVLFVSSFYLRQYQCTDPFCMPICFLQCTAIIIIASVICQLTVVYDHWAVTMSSAVIIFTFFWLAVFSTSTVFTVFNILSGWVCVIVSPSYTGQHSVLIIGSTKRNAAILFSYYWCNTRDGYAVGDPIFMDHDRIWTYR